ncbi:pyridoxine 5'-phosphate synthase [Telmatocola sphagniphila]|uniref:Pyridoxine 5'-phosphate synthase n=1 Tax=Telmatocola sphagniphila TaxID=1123043 RepID=A0A8E6ETU8_9BACT|nr:pyridoxine 5'-phosphate synthase [Telmatocola sphagniphila]QVL32884.1 pyridoxine 5'-phosphate synthase [Telmatocola sphagniphila]
MIRLGVNIDHVATVRQARRGFEPDPVLAAGLALLGGADTITIHLREDRRHIQDRDLYILRQTLPSGLNLEMACSDEIVQLALKTKPDQVTLVPEKRQELTTEGGLDVIGNEAAVAQVTQQLGSAGIDVSLFIDPSIEQVEKSAKLGVRAIEFHTGSYAEARGRDAVAHQLGLLRKAAARAIKLGLHVHMGHGLNYLNVQPIVRIPGVEELNIGHSIISRAIFVGLERAVREMKLAMQENFPHPEV